MSEQNNAVLNGDVRGENALRLMCVHLKTVNFPVDTMFDWRRYKQNECTVKDGQCGS